MRGDFMKDYATLSNKGEYTIFTYEDCEIRFKTSHMLERYTKILEWDNGYLVVMAKYRNNTTVEEEYIDLIPILQNLYINEEEFLKTISKVEIQTEMRNDYD